MDFNFAVQKIRIRNISSNGQSVEKISNEANLFIPGHWCTSMDYPKVSVRESKIISSRATELCKNIGSAGKKTTKVTLWNYKLEASKNNEGRFGETKKSKKWQRV